MTAAGHTTARRHDGWDDRESAAAAHPFAGAGEMRARCRALDWAATRLGPVDGWPTAVRTAVRLALDSGFPACVFAGPDLVLVHNDAFARVLGATGHPDALGRPARDLWPEPPNAVPPEVAQVYGSGVPVWREDREAGVRRDGRLEETFWTYALTPVHAERGAVVGVLGVFVETTDQVRARRVIEPLLVESERARADAEAARERSEAVLASIADAFYLLDRQWRFTYVNDAAEPLLQTTRDALLGRTLWEAFPGVVGSVFEGPYREAMATGHVTSAEAYFEPLGTWFDVRTYPWAGGLMVHFRDVGARQAAEAEREHLIAALEAAQGRMSFLAAASGALAESLEPEAVLRTVARLAVGTAEAPGLADACVLTLATPEQAREGRWSAVIEGVDLEKVAIERERQRRFPAPPDGPRGFPAVIRTGRSELVTPQMMEEQLRAVSANPDHWSYFEALDLYSAVSAPLIARGRILGALTLVRHGPTRRGALDAVDLALAEELARRAAVALDNARLYVASQRSRAEAESAQADAEAARAAAESASRAKSDFLAVMSHELRTPLNAIGGYAELLELGLRGPVTDQQRADLARIQASQRHLLGLINQVLNYTRVDAGAVRYDIADVPVSDALAAAEALVLPQVRARGLTSVLGRCPPGLAVRADGEKLQQILLNLLSNAIKFTEPGGEVRVTCTAGDEVVEIAVTDTGVGIAPEKLASIFEPFVQVDQRHTRPNEGVGLGLAISRDLARGMSGDLAATSVPGEGSTFTLAVPRVRP